MFWKNWPSWLKWGIIVEIVAVLIILGYGFIWKPILGDNLGIVLLFIPGVLLTYFISSKCFLAGFSARPDNCPVSGDTFGIILIVASLIAWFIIGALIGWLIGRRSKKQKPIQNKSR